MLYSTVLGSKSVISVVVVVVVIGYLRVDLKGEEGFLVGLPRYFLKRLSRLEVEGRG